jgi:PAB1-binding protein PBP1
LHEITPDFYLPGTDEFIEIKGYKTEKDTAKWNQFPADKKLTILMHKELKDMQII